MTVLRKGNKGEEVKALQSKLGLMADGIFGQLTEEAVRDFQRKNGLFPDGIVGPKTWAVIFEDKGYVLKKSRRLITDLVVHCTASPEGREMTVDQIRAMHTAPVSKGGRGWNDIGYHYVICLDGSIHNGRDVDFIGAHVSGHNSNTIGIVYVGGLATDCKTAKDTRTAKQKEALVKLLTELRKFYPSAKIRGHRDFSKDLNGNGIIEPKEWIKACPCFDARTEYKDI